MKFSELAGYFLELEKTASRNSMTEMLAELFGEVSKDEIGEVCFLALGQLGPLYDRVDFNLADKMVMRGLARLFEVEPADVLKKYKVIGDLGLVGETLRAEKNYKESGLSVAEVYAKLMAIANEGGQGSQERKIDGLVLLLKELDSLSVRFVVRMVLGRLRLGFSDKTMLDALAVWDGGNKLGRKELDEAYQVFPDIAEIARLVKEFGIKGISKKVAVTLGVPVMPALCQRLKTAEEMIAKMGTVLVEPKFDGTRVQIHIKKQRAKSKNNKLEKNWEVRTFTRNLDETTHMFPELLEAVQFVEAEELILDSEAVGFDPRTGKMLSFQMTITRKRKHGIEEAARTVPLKFFVFDVLYKNGESLIQVPLHERRRMLQEVIRPGGALVIDEVLETNNPDILRNYHKEKLNQGWEGVVIKQINSPYEPGRRGFAWVKFKEEEAAAGKLSDTLDCVVMGFYRGKGKRAQFGIGAFLVGVRDPSAAPSRGGQAEQVGDVVTIAKIGTGLSDEQWQELRRRLEENVAMEMPTEYVVDKGLVPDVWVDPTVVVEIAADEITKSPNHSAGVALRFPRLVKFRDDKSVEQITTTDEVKQIKVS